MLHQPLFLNDISGSEIMVILLFVLMFFGAKSIPSMAKTLGKTLFQIRNATSEIQNEIRKSGIEISKDMNIGQILKDKQEELTQPMDQVYSEIENTIHYAAKETPKTISNEALLPVEEIKEEITTEKTK
jgi:sec-independent protein translocase protein TatA